MLTQEQVLAAVKDGRKSKCLDSRDYARLMDFFPASEWAAFGFEAEEAADAPVPWTQENILEQLRRDVEFGFEKALDRRGISAGLMYNVVKMWMWVMEDDLQDHDEYAMYGLPLFKAVAVKYGFDNPIGDDSGAEDSYNE